MQYIHSCMASVYIECCHKYIIHTFCIPKKNRNDIDSISHTFTDDQTRVRLMPYEGVEGSDYINANFIDVS